MAGLDARGVGFWMCVLEGWGGGDGEVLTF